MTALALRGRPSSIYLAELREQLEDAEEALDDVRTDTLEAIRLALPDARRLRAYFAHAGSLVGEQLATNLVGRLETLERRLTPAPDEPTQAFAA